MIENCIDKMCPLINWLSKTWNASFILGRKILHFQHKVRLINGSFMSIIDKRKLNYIYIKV